jgi:hypothetical protein
LTEKNVTVEFDFKFIYELSSSTPLIIPIASLQFLFENSQGYLHLKVHHSAGIFKQSLGARNRLGIGLPYQPTRLHILAELVTWNRFLRSLKV